MNDPLFDFGPVALAYQLHGYEDSFVDMAMWNRATTYSEDHYFTLDYMFSTVGCLCNPVIGNADEYANFSDHRPIFATLDLACFLS